MAVLGRDSQNHVAGRAELDGDTLSNANHKQTNVNVKPQGWNHPPRETITNADRIIQLKMSFKDSTTLLKS